MTSTPSSLMTNAADGTRTGTLPSLLCQSRPAARARIAGLARLRETRSTNDLLLAMPFGACHGWVILAHAQSGARGRNGRQWHSPPGAGLYLSIGWVFPGIDRSQVGPLSLRIGLVLAEVLAPWGGGRIGLKWPNDLLAGDAKLAGVLIETRAGAGDLAVVVGIGVNVRKPHLGEFAAAGSVTSLEQLAEDGGPTVETVALAVIPAIIDALATWDPADSAVWLPRWRSLDILADQWVSWIEAGVRHEGRARGPLADGALLVETIAGARQVRAGEVERLRPARAPAV